MLKLFWSLAFLSILCLSLSFSTTAGTLFSDDFEGETIGEEASQWEHFGGAEGEGAKVVKDPLNPGNKVFFINSPEWVGDLPEGAWAPKDESFLSWTDYTFEGDFMVDDATKLFAFNYRAADYDNLLNYNVRRWDTGTVGLYKRENGEWTGAVIKIQHPTDAEKWYTAQIICKENHHILKLKERNDSTDFSEIDPLIEVDVEGTKLDHGTINVMSYGFVDNVIVYVGTKDVEPSSKLATTWGFLKIKY